jgi:hypothetical protein
MYKTADDLAKLDESIANAYIDKTGMGREEVLKMMDVTTWLGAEEAKEKIKSLNALQAKPEDVEKVRSQFSSFFRGINAKDKGRLQSTTSAGMNVNYSGKSGSPAQYMTDIYQADITNMLWRLNNDFKVTKRQVGEGKYEYTANFTATQEVTRKEQGKSTLKYVVSGRLNADGKITSLSVSRAN